jgi:Fasciclin domain
MLLYVMKNLSAFKRASINSFVLLPQDKVLLPPRSSIAALADDAGTFTTLLELLTAADLASIFADDDAGPFTLFAPTDDAFAKLGISTEELTKDVEALANILRYHVVSSRIPSARLMKMPRVIMLNKEAVTVDRNTLNNNANIVGKDLLATNGIVHVIDRVLIPRAGVEDEDDGEMSVAPSMTPALVPSMTPVLVPSMAPVLTPSMTPLLAPSVTPVLAPSVTPVLAPSVMPVIAPIVPPVLTPSLTPVTTPVVAPVLTPSLTPVIAPSVTPVLTPPSLTPVTAPGVTPVLTPSLTPVIPPIMTPVLTPSLTPVIAPVVTPALTPSLMPVVAATTLTVTADTETLDTCEDLGDFTSCPISTDFELEGQFAFMAADVVCPTDVVTQTNFAEASRQDGVCECEATKDDTQEMDCQCALCPEGSALQFAYTCTLAIIADCTSINCSGECGDAVTI